VYNLFVIYDEIKFNKDKKTGYYLSNRKVNGTRIRLHRYVWIKFNGGIPKDYHIHHIDHNKDNNDISNLILISKQEHSIHHGKNNVEKMRIMAEENRHLTKEWHGSLEGKEWHKQHYENVKDKMHIRLIKNCLCCGIEFETNSHGKFCHNNCKSKYRRKLIREGFLLK
jgi:hypothetical protein